MRGPFTAAAVTAVLGVASWAVPLPHVSGAAVGLVGLTRGAASGLTVALLAGVMVAAVALGLFGTGGPAALLVTFWLLSLGLALVLRRSADQGWLIAAAAVAAVSGTLLLRVWAGDVTALWLQVMERLLTLLIAAGSQVGRPDPETLRRAAAMMTSVLAAGLVVNVTLTVLLARWWQSLLYYPGGFRTEFHRLALPRSFLRGMALALGLSLAALALSPGAGGLAADIVAVTVVVLVIQGVAVAHHEVARRKLHRGWLVAMYAGLIFFGQISVPAVALLAAVDAVADLRGLRRTPPAEPPAAN